MEAHLSYDYQADDIAPAIGHNSDGHLSVEYAPMIRRFIQMIAMGQGFLEDHPAITSDEQAGLLAGIVKQIKTHRAAVEAARKVEKQPSLDEGRHVDQFFSDGMVKPLDDLAARLLALGTPYVKANGKVRGDFAALGTRVLYTYRVTDITKIPSELLLVNHSAIMALIHGKDGRRDIPGLEIEVTVEAANR